MEKSIGIDIHNLTEEQKTRLEEIKKERELKLVEVRKRQAEKDKMIRDTFDYMRANGIEVLDNENGHFSIRKRSK